MRLKEINDAVASTCNVRANVVTAVQNETFRQIRLALDKGEKVVLPEFGTFVVKEVPGDPGAAAKKVVRFREQRPEGAEGAAGKGAAPARNKNRPAAPAASTDDDEE
jgi:nucleoid DNA-binding protein